MIVKVCGLRDPDNIRAVERLPVDLCGFIFYPRSPRCVPDDEFHAAAVRQLPQARGRGLRGRLARRDAPHGRTLRPRVAPAPRRRVARSVRGASAARLPDHQGDPRRVGRRPRVGPGLRRLRRLPAVRHPLRRLRRFGTTLRLVGARRLCGPRSVSAQRRNRRGVRRSGPGIRPSPFRRRGSQQRIRNGPGGEGRRKTRKFISKIQLP